MRKVVIGIAIMVLGGGAWAADFVIERAPHPPVSAYTRGADATHELLWDNGTAQNFLYYGYGTNIWMGNHFDISTISTFNYIKTLRIYASPAPGGWDGWRLGVFRFAGGVPGSLLWGPNFVTCSVTGWNDFAVGWNLPGGLNEFVAAIEQYYDPPNCDSIAVDSNRVRTLHTWIYVNNQWERLNAPGGYSNVMLRVVVDDEHPPAVAPTSLGRVRALYH